MKKLAVLALVAVSVWILLKARDRAVHSVRLAHETDAVGRAKGIGALDDKRQLDLLANPAAAPGRAEDDAMERSPFHFLAVAPAGRYLRIAGPLAIPSKDPVRLVLEIHPDLVADDMPDPAAGPGEPSRPDRRISNTTFEVTSDPDGAARPAPFRAYCSLAPEPSDILVTLEIGGNRDALDAASRRIHEQELARTITSADARSQLSALRDRFVPNASGTYRVRAVYRHGKLVTAPITVIVTD